jgi:hypothetical protein
MLHEEDKMYKMIIIFLYKQEEYSIFLICREDYGTFVLLNCLLRMVT